MIPVYEVEAEFLGYYSIITITSVAGHVFNRDFPEKYSNWNAVDPIQLFDAETIKKEANPKVLINFKRNIHNFLLF